MILHWVEIRNWQEEVFFVSIFIIIETMNRAAAAEQGQEALYSFLVAWQEGLNILASTRIEPTIAADQLQKIKERYTKHMADLEAAAAVIDSTENQQNITQVTSSNLFTLRVIWMIRVFLSAGTPAGTSF